MTRRLDPNGPLRPPGPLYERVLSALIGLLLLGSLALAGANRVKYSLIALGASFALLLMRDMVRRIREKPLHDGQDGVVDPSPPHQDPSVEYQPPDPD